MWKVVGMRSPIFLKAYVLYSMCVRGSSIRTFTLVVEMSIGRHSEPTQPLTRCLNQDAVEWHKSRHFNVPSFGLECWLALSYEQFVLATQKLNFCPTKNGSHDEIFSTWMPFQSVYMAKSWNFRYLFGNWKFRTHIFVMLSALLFVFVTWTPSQTENLQNIKWFNRLASPKQMRMTVNVNTNNHLITRMINELGSKAESFQHY